MTIDDKTVPLEDVDIMSPAEEIAALHRTVEQQAQQIDRLLATNRTQRETIERLKSGSYLGQLTDIRDMLEGLIERQFDQAVTETTIRVLRVPHQTDFEIPAGWRIAQAWTLPDHPAPVHYVMIASQ